MVPILYRHLSLGIVLCCLRTLCYFFGCSNLIYVVEVRFGDVCGLSLVGCCLCEYKIGMLG